jgi:hypothetical protein
MVWDSSLHEVFMWHMQLQRQALLHNTMSDVGPQPTNPTHTATHRYRSWQQELQNTQIEKTMQQNAVLTLLDGAPNSGPAASAHTLVLTRWRGGRPASALDPTSH